MVSTTQHAAKRALRLPARPLLTDRRLGLVRTPETILIGGDGRSIASAKLHWQRRLWRHCHWLGRGVGMAGIAPAIPRSIQSVIVTLQGREAPRTCRSSSVLRDHCRRQALALARSDFGNCPGSLRIFLARDWPIRFFFSSKAKMGVCPLEINGPKCEGFLPMPLGEPDPLSSRPSSWPGSRVVVGDQSLYWHLMT